MKKRILSLLLAAAVMAGTLTVAAAAGFSDIRDSATATAAAALESMGIVTGTGAGTYSPDKTLTRAEFAALAVRTMGLADKVSANANRMLFSDTPPGKWYTGYVNLAYSEGIINGYGNGKFGPDDTVTYGQVVTILLRMLGYTENEIGKSWPADYVSFAAALGISDGLSLSQDTAVNRGQAAVLLYNTVLETPNGGVKPYFETISGVVAVKNAILLSNGGSSDSVTVCSVGEASAVIESYTPKHPVSDALVGNLGVLLLDSAGRAVGFVPDGEGYTDITVSSATASGITTKSGETIRITGSVSVISGGSVYVYNSKGYLQVDGQAGKNARLYYDASGAVSHIYITSGASLADTYAAVAETENASMDLSRALGIGTTVYSVVKNGVAAQKTDLARYDVAYYDAASNTMYASDRKITGTVTSASPSVGAAVTVTIAGAVLDVLPCAWDTLGNFKLGDAVTLLLTDDNKVAAAYSSSAVRAPMLGVLSSDGSSVTLCGSGITLGAGGGAPSTDGMGTTAESAAAISSSVTSYGGLVRVAAVGGTITCSALADALTSGSVNLTAETVGSYTLAPGAEIYENAAAETAVYSLSGEKGAPSYDFSDIYWTDSLPSSRVAYYHLNELGQIDVLLLRDVTGNCYEYGRLTVYGGKNGINLGSSGLDAYNDALTVTNSQNPSGSAKYLFPAQNLTSGFAGIALNNYTSSYKSVASYSKLSSASLGTSGLFQVGDEWYTSVAGFEIPVSANTEVFISSTSTWLSGESGILTAISSGMSLTVYYDRTPTTGAQVRIIVVS